MGRGPEYLTHKNPEIENSQKRVVVTGMGTINPLGLNVLDFWRNLVDGKSGISNIEFPFTKVKVAGVVRDFKPEIMLSSLVPLKHLKRLSRPVQFAVAAVKEALLQAHEGHD